MQSTIVIDSIRLVALGTTAVGIGGLCLYGLLSKPVSSLDKSASERAIAWPEYVRSRVRATYCYFAGGVGIVAASAITLVHNPTFMRVMASCGLAGPICLVVVNIGSLIACLMMPYPESAGVFNGKHLTWLMFTTTLGGMLSPVCLIGGPVLIRAALYTGGIVGSLSVVAASSPSNEFLDLGGPLSIGLGVIFVSSLGGLFLSPMSHLGAEMSAINFYGGLALFSAYLLYDTQLVIKRAEQHPPPRHYNEQMMSQYAVRPFDPINSSIGILLDTVNIFVRMVIILSKRPRRK